MGNDILNDDILDEEIEDMEIDKEKEPDMCDCGECRECIEKEGECTCGDCDICEKRDALEEMDEEDLYDDVEPEDLM